MCSRIDWFFMQFQKEYQQIPSTLLPGTRVRTRSTFVGIESILEPSFFEFIGIARLPVDVHGGLMNDDDSTLDDLILVWSLLLSFAQDDGPSIKTQREYRRQDALGVFQMRLAVDGGYKKASHGSVLSES